MGTEDSASLGTGGAGARPTLATWAFASTTLGLALLSLECWSFEV